MRPPLKKILYAEDEPDIQIVARLALERLGGYTLKICNNGAEAVEAAPAFAPDLVLLDMMMPGMDGVTTLKTMRENPALSQIPVMFMTAKIQAEFVSRFKELGALWVIMKPFDPMKLPSIIQNVWDGKPVE